MIKVDTHIHTKYSPDADPKASIELYCQACKEKGVDVICFTDHIDTYGAYETYSTFDFDNRYKDFCDCRARYGNSITLLYGLEYAEPNYDKALFRKILSAYQYDFVLGSVHDPTEKFLHRYYDAATLTSEQYRLTKLMAAQGDFDSLAHLDFPKKYCRNWRADQQQIDEILKIIIARDISLEINTSGLRHHIKEASPSKEIIERYVQLGGVFVTIGSDCHCVEDLYTDCQKVTEGLNPKLKVCYYKNRKRIVL